MQRFFVVLAACVLPGCTVVAGEPGSQGSTKDLPDATVRLAQLSATAVREAELAVAALAVPSGGVNGDAQTTIRAVRQATGAVTRLQEALVAAVPRYRALARKLSLDALKETTTRTDSLAMSIAIDQRGDTCLRRSGKLHCPAQLEKLLAEVADLGKLKSRLANLREVLPAEEGNRLLAEATRREKERCGELARLIQELVEVCGEEAFTPQLKAKAGAPSRRREARRQLPQKAAEKASRSEPAQRTRQVVPERPADFVLVRHHGRSAALRLHRKEDVRRLRQGQLLQLYRRQEGRLILSATVGVTDVTDFGAVVQARSGSLALKDVGYLPAEAAGDAPAPVPDALPLRRMLQPNRVVPSWRE
jgi:hypothetical protein